MTQKTRFALDGQVAMVTGAASGLGLAIAEVLAEAGAHVALTDIDTGGLERAAGRIAAAGGSAEAILLDVSDRAAIRQATDALAARHGRLDIMVANAGVTAGPGYLTELGQINAVDDGQWDRVLQINLSGVKSEVMCGYAYTATKAAVVNLVRQSAMELAACNVMVNGIAPGPFRTNIANGRIQQTEVAAQFASMVPLGRIADPEEIKGLALLLASPASSFITGVTIPIDGGIMAR